MSQYAFYVNSDDCIGCKVCVVACKDKKDLKPGRKLRRVYTCTVGGWSVRNGLYEQNGVFAYSLSVACNHCAEPACMKICPTGAIGKRADGIVFIDENMCSGCGSCAAACPYQAPHLDPDKMKAVKCDACRELLGTDEKPVCVSACPQRALDFGDLEYLKSKYGAGDNTVPPLPDPSETTPSLVVKPHRKLTPTMNVTVYNMPEELQTSENAE